MATDFSQVLSKLRWTKRQIALLDLAVTDYINLDPYVPAVEDQPEAQGYLVTAKLRYPPPADLAHIVGDVLNNLQGTLDYLAYQLVLRENGTPDRTSVFPIVKPSKDGLAEQRVNIFRRKKNDRGERVALIADQDVLALLRSVQPYHYGDRWADHPLALLKALNGESKHRYPAIIATMLSGARYTYTRNGVRVATVTDGPIKDGDKIAWFPYAQGTNPGPPEDQILAPHISFESVKPDFGTPLMDSIALIYECIRMDICSSAFAMFAPDVPFFI